MKTKAKIETIKQILEAIDSPTYMTRIYRKTSLCYATIFSKIKEMEKMGLIRTIKKGRVRLVYLTKKGKALKEIVCGKKPKVVKNA